MEQMPLKRWAESDLVMISALEHYSYCPRQCALIHVEHVYDENIYTLRGRRVHDQVDVPGASLEDGVRIERALPLWSERLGLIGRADVVEFLPDGTPYPVEYKHGPRRRKIHDDLQLCAQAICLEEMLRTVVPEGAIFHHSSRRRRPVTFSAELRETVEKTVEAVRVLNDSPVLPSPPDASLTRCRHCSLHDACMPEAVVKAKPDTEAQGLFKLIDEPKESI